MSINFPVIGPLSGSLGLLGFSGGLTLFGVSPLLRRVRVTLAPSMMRSRPASEPETLLSNLLPLENGSTGASAGSKSPNGTSSGAEGRLPASSLSRNLRSLSRPRSAILRAPSPTASRALPAASPAASRTCSRRSLFSGVSSASAVALAALPTPRFSGSGSPSGAILSSFERMDFACSSVIFPRSISS